MATSEERRSRLLEIIRVNQFASLPNLATELGVSESTVRRDLDFLEETGTAKRTHGGVFYTGPRPKIPHFEKRQQTQWEKKRRIAQAANELIEDSDTLLLDGGSTTYELAQLLVHRPLQVVTNSLPVATLFMSSETSDLVVVGGYVHSKTGVCLGNYANQMLSDLNVRYAVISVAGLNEAGLYNSNLMLVETEQCMMQSADEVIVLCDSTKFGRSSLARMGGLTDIDTLIVDADISEIWRERIIEAGVRLVIASTETSDTDEDTVTN